jgi:hypothetical protein
MKKENEGSAGFWTNLWQKSFPFKGTEGETNQVVGKIYGLDYLPRTCL